MARQTIEINYPVGSPIPSNNLNNNGKNLIYILDENTVFTGNKSFGGNITQTSGVTSLKETTISTDLKFLGSQHRIMSDQTTATGAFIELRGGDVGVSDSQINFKTNGTTTRYQISKLGNSIFGGGVDNAIDLIQAGAGLDESFAFGQSRMGYIGTTGQFVMALSSLFNITDYGILLASGGTNINALASGLVRIRNANVDIITASGIAIDLKKPVTITGTVNNGYGDNDILPPLLYQGRVNVGNPYNLPALAIKETSNIVTAASLSGSNIKTPSTGVYSYTYTRSNGQIFSDVAVAANTSMFFTSGPNERANIFYTRVS